MGVTPTGPTAVLRAVWGDRAERSVHFPVFDARPALSQSRDVQGAGARLPVPPDGSLPRDCPQTRGATPPPAPRGSGPAELAHDLTDPRERLALVEVDVGSGGQRGLLLLLGAEARQHDD